MKKPNCRTPHTAKIYKPLTEWERKATAVLCLKCGNEIPRVMASDEEIAAYNKELEKFSQGLDVLFGAVPKTKEAAGV